MGVAEAVPGVGLPVAVAVLLEQGEGLLVIAELGVVPADRVEGGGLPDLVAGGPGTELGPARRGRGPRRGGFAAPTGRRGCGECGPDRRTGGTGRGRVGGVFRGNAGLG